MRNSADLGGCYPPRPSASMNNTLLDLENSPYPTQLHSLYPGIFLEDANMYFPNLFSTMESITCR